MQKSDMGQNWHCQIQPPALAQQALGREKNSETKFFAQMDQNFFWPKRMKGGRVIRPFIVHKVTE